jgi:long-chain fatty acid transport protein
MRKKINVAVLCFTVALMAFSTTAFATNGMDLEGYGPIATGMGGASMAYDNGTAAMMNNPATLGLMPSGDRLDAALGVLGPHITASTPGAPDATSSSNAFYMPAVGWATKSGALTYGFGVFAQGGMGTKYDGNSFLAAGSGEEVKSQLGVGRAMIPVAYNVNDKFTIGGSLDFVWASLDLKMALNGAQFGDMVAALGGHQTTGTASGSMVDTLAGAFGSGALTGLNWARFDFNEDNPFEGAARSYGVAAKIGGVYKVTDALALGAVYQSETDLSDMEADGATVSMNVVGPGVGGGPVTIPVTGKIKVVDFQWPQTVGLGAAYQATDKLMIVFDYKWINWKTTMKNFKMTFTADSSQANPLAAGFGLGGQSIDAVLYQDWKNQNVFMLGAGYKVTDEFTVRAGVNIANNPVPSQYMNPLFPAIEEDHYMVGAGYMFTKASSIDASFTYAPPVSETTQVLTPGGPVPVTVSHFQTNGQVMYSYRF